MAGLHFKIVQKDINVRNFTVANTTGLHLEATKDFPSVAPIKRLRSGAIVDMTRKADQVSRKAIGIGIALKHGKTYLVSLPHRVIALNR